MKLAFDEHIPPMMVKVFQDLASEPGLKRHLKSITIVKARDYAPAKDDPDYIRKSDVPWIRRYKADGGRLIVSGNTRMVEVPQELLALQQCGMVVFFFPPVWNGWRAPRKMALLLVWIERIVSLGRLAKAGMLYRISDKWLETADFLIVRQPTPLQLRGSHGPDAPAKARAKLPPRPRRKRSSTAPLLDLLAVEPAVARQSDE